MVRTLALLSLLALAACQTASGDFCDLNHPRRLSAATIDAMTDAEVNEALAFNLKGGKLCGWRP